MGRLMNFFWGVIRHQELETLLAKCQEDEDEWVRALSKIIRIKTVEENSRKCTRVLIDGSEQLADCSNLQVG